MSSTRTYVSQCGGASTPSGMAMQPARSLPPELNTVYMPIPMSMSLAPQPKTSL